MLGDCMPRAGVRVGVSLPGVRGRPGVRDPASMACSASSVRFCCMAGVWVRAVKRSDSGALALHAAADYIRCAHAGSSCVLPSAEPF